MTKISPRILITNDDGVDAAGLKVMQKIAADLSDDVWVVAPVSNQSGAGHRFTLGHELQMDQRSDRVFAVPGTPADCVVVGCTHLLKDRPPDVVLSGVNQGQNLGDIIHCSGTAAGAREGALQGAVGIALSQAIDFAREHEVNWDSAAKHGARIVREILSLGRQRDVYYNVNFPMAESGRVPQTRVVPHQRFSRSPFSYYASKNPGKFFVAVPETPTPLNEGHDFHVLHFEHAITITPLSLLMTADKYVAEMEAHFSGRGGEKTG